MTLPTGVQIVSENNYGRPDKALNYMKRMARSFGYALPGSTYEVSPDYGMMTQAWNIYGYAVPIVEQFFGIHPMAAQQKVYIRPQMPLEWDTASLENVGIDNNELSIFYERGSGETVIRISQVRSDWELEIELPKEPSSDIEVEGTHQISLGETTYIVTTREKEIVIVLKDGEA